MTTVQGATRTVSRSVSVAERRTRPRIELCVGVGFQSDTNFYTGFTQDLSEGGLFVATHAIKAVGTVLRLTFSLPCGREISALSVVRWVCDPYEVDADAVPGMGVEFLELNDDDLAVVQEFISLREPLFYVT